MRCGSFLARTPGRLRTFGFACILTACSSDKSHPDTAAPGGTELDPSLSNMPSNGQMQEMVPADTSGAVSQPTPTELNPEDVPLDMPMPEPTSTGSTEPEPTGPVVWPNPESSTNSDPWLPEHHDEITKLEPRVLVVNFDDARDGAAALAFAQRVGAAFAEASRYHGYKDPAAPVFLDYKFVHVADLPDNKTRAGNGFGFNEFMHSTEFAALVNFKHPQTGATLTVCQMFEQGIINEAWVAEPPDDGQKLYEYLGRAQVYDANMQKVPGRFDNCAGNGCIPANTVTCGVSVRLNELNISRGPGCATHAQGHGIEGTIKSRTQPLPYLTANARRFFNFNLNQRYGTSFNDFYSCNYDSTTCINYVTPTHLTGGAGIAAFDIANFGDGCGNVHFAPHSRFHYDYERQSAGVTGETSCEHYGLGDGEGGADARNLVSYDTYRAYNENRAYSDCGGGWSVYMRQNFPGYQNAAKDTDGNPMKNWWPFLFY
jgi:hypothetical protein